MIKSVLGIWTMEIRHWTFDQEIDFQHLLSFVQCQIVLSIYLFLFLQLISLFFQAAQFVFRFFYFCLELS